MEVFENKGDCRFHGSLATDRAGRLYDSRFRDAIRSNRRPLSEREVRTVEAMTALRITARLTRQLMDRWPTSLASITTRARRCAESAVERSISTEPAAARPA